MRPSVMAIATARCEAKGGGVLVLVLLLTDDSLLVCSLVPELVGRRGSVVFVIVMLGMWLLSCVVPQVTKSNLCVKAYLKV